MQNLISSWAIAVTVAVIFSSIVSSLLPETSIKKYITIVLGVVVTIVILSPLFKLFEGAGYEKEIDKALNSISAENSSKYDSSSYMDYLYKTYNIPKNK